MGCIYKLLGGSDSSKLFICITGKLEPGECSRCTECVCWRAMWHACLEIGLRASWRSAAL